MVVVGGTQVASFGPSAMNDQFLHSDLPAPPAPVEDDLGWDETSVPFTVWPCGKPHARSVKRLFACGQRDGAIPLSLMRHVVTTYTAPGEHIAMPLPGQGGADLYDGIDSLSEAARYGRHAIGIEYEPRWAHLARANLAYAADLGTTGTGKVITGDARNLSVLTADSNLAGKVALLLTSPPYGASVHGQVRPRLAAPAPPGPRFISLFMKISSSCVRAHEWRVASGGSGLRALAWIVARGRQRPQAS